ncbi:ABC transporter permease subunit [Rosenbergiella collisarenosi]|uniref:ABC transporter permease subunit n=1 Tax=Rosenbergiella collisarenosi TaxID=1544695 RepID=UPI001F4E3FED|nr:ABC transporter permease subunit [Rosenbergiella collisarenosi]
MSLLRHTSASWRLNNHLWSVSTLTVVIIIGAWFTASYLGWINTLFFPSPAELFLAFKQLWQQGYLDITLAQHINASLLRVLTALGIALVTAIPLGIVMGLTPVIRAIFTPILDFYRPIPPLAYLPLIVIWLGIGEVSKILLIYLAIFAPLTISTAEAVRRVEPHRIQAVRCLGASSLQVIRLVILPSIIPELLTGIRISLGVGWSTLVAAELIAANRGLGFMVQSAAQFLSTDVVVAGIIMIAIVALLIELLLRQLQKRFARWSLYDY